MEQRREQKKGGKKLRQQVESKTYTETHKNIIYTLKKQINK